MASKRREAWGVTDLPELPLQTQKGNKPYCKAALTVSPL